MRETWDVTLYDADATDFETEGVCSIDPISCYMEESSEDNSCEVTLEAPYDSRGKWKYLTPGRLMKVWMLMRDAPNINAEGLHRTTRINMVVTADSSETLRSLWESEYAFKNGGTPLYVIPAGTNIGSYKDISMPSAETWETTDGYACVIKLTVNGYTGYLNTDCIENTIVDIPEDDEQYMIPNRDIADVSVRYQMFEIYNVKKNADSITVNAWHYTYRAYKVFTGRHVTLSDNAVKPNAIRNLVGYYVVTDLTNDITFQCNLSDERTECALAKNARSPLWTYADYDMCGAKTLLDPENGFIEWYGFEVMRDNKMIYLWDSLGFDRGVTLETGHNVSGIDITTDISEMYTHIAPHIEPNTKLQGLGVTSYNILACEPQYNAEKIAASPELYGTPKYYSPHLENWDDAFTGEGGSLLIPTDECKAAGIAYAAKLLKSGIDDPTVSVSVDVTQVDSDEGAQMIELLEPLCLHDTVRVHLSEYNTDVTATVVQRRWDCVHQRLDSLQIGNVRSGIGNNKTYSYQIESVAASKVTDLDKQIETDLMNEATSSLSGSIQTAAAKGARIFSQAEHECGKWIDSSTVYVRTFTGAVAANTTTTISASDFDLTGKTIVDMAGACVKSSGYVNPLTYYVSGTDYNRAWADGNTKAIVARCNEAATFYVSVYYIKTA